MLHNVAVSRGAKQSESNNFQTRQWVKAFISRHLESFSYCPLVCQQLFDFLSVWKGLEYAATEGMRMVWAKSDGYHI